MPSPVEERAIDRARFHRANRNFMLRFDQAVLDQMSANLTVPPPPERARSSKRKPASSSAD